MLFINKLDHVVLAADDIDIFACILFSGSLH